MGVLVKNPLNLIPFPPIPPNFGENENLRFKGNREECVFPPTNSIPSNLNSQKSPFPPLKLPNKGIEEYSKIILFISFHSLIPNKA